MNRICIVGEQCSGKTQISNFIHDIKRCIDVIKFADPIYETLTSLREGKNRMYMQEFGDLAKKHFGEDVFVKCFESTFRWLSDSLTGVVVCDDVRRKIELDKVHQLGFKSIYVDCDRDVRKERAFKLGLEFIENHNSETEVSSLQPYCEYYIDNSDINLDVLKGTVAILLEGGK